MEPQTWLVFWGAFGGGAAAGIFTLIAVVVAEWIRWFIDRPLLKVRGWTGYVVSVLDDSDVRRLFLEAQNPHTKPVTVSSFGLSYKNRKFGGLVITPQLGWQLPYQIDGGKSLTQWVDIPKLIEALREQGRSPSDLRAVVFNSSTGKDFVGKMTKDVIKELQTQFNESKPEEW